METKLSFEEYYHGKLKEGVKLFNTLMAGDFETDTLESQCKRINLQLGIVAQELYEEYFKFFAKDQLEELDAIADVLFVVSELERQLSILSELEQTNSAAAEYIANNINHSALNLLSSAIGLFYETFTEHYDLDVILEATDRVIENNMSKFTTDKEEAEKWEAPAKENLTLSETVVNVGDGSTVTYYCFKNNDGKVRKKKGFKQVKLQDLVDKQNERINTFTEQSSDDVNSKFEA